jgi:uncharacterized protein YoxC
VFAADVSLADVSALIIAIVSVVAVVLLVFVVVAVNRTLTTVRMSVEQLRREALPVIEEAHRTLVTANGELERVDTLLESATSVTNTVDSVGHLVSLVVANPLMKTVAAGSGVLRAARSFRRR